MCSNNSNNYKNQKLRGIKRKYEAILNRGGKCEKCGYDKNIASFEFHHLDPNEKEFNIDVRKFSNTKLTDLQKELDKCVLLCANCHREEHNPDLDINNISGIIKDSESKKSFSNQLNNMLICPVCGSSFKKWERKTYCSNKCRDSVRFANYPSLEEIEFRYKELGSWEKVAQSFNLTRRIIQGIRKRSKE